MKNHKANEHHNENNNCDNGKCKYFTNNSNDCHCGCDDCNECNGNDCDNKKCECGCKDCTCNAKPKGECCD